LKIPDGYFITLEGIEGSGKTTQARRLAERLESHGYEVTLTREPGGTPVGMKIRGALLDPENEGMDPVAEMLLYAADRAEHMAKVIRPALARGGVVICDRHADATVAYQGYGRGLNLGLIERMNETATGGIRPDLTVVFELTTVLGLTRAIDRNEDAGTFDESRFEQEELEFHERVREGYLDIASKEPQRVKVIDASGTEDEVYGILAGLVEAALAGAAGRGAGETR